MDPRRLVSSLGFTFIVCGWAATALTGCSQEENLEPDPGASPFYPGRAEPKSASRDQATGAESGNGASAGLSEKGGTASPGPGESPKIDARFGTNEVERQLRIALRTAQKGDPAVADDLLDKVLAIEPVNREALLGRAALAFDQSLAAKSVEDRAAAIDKSIEFVRALMRAYDTLKPHETDVAKRVFYAKLKVLVEQGRFDQAVSSLKEVNELGFDGFGKVESDKTMEPLRSSPQYKAGLKTDEETRLARARERTKDLQAPPADARFNFTLSDMEGKKVSLSDFKGKVVVADFWGTWCGPCRDAIPGLIALYKRRHSQGLEVVGLSYERDAESEAQAREMIKKFVKEVGVPYQCLLGDVDTLKQVPDFKGFPSTVIIDRAGKVRVFITENTTTTLETISDLVRVLLAEPAPKAGAAAKKS
jgi:thiol-disulfide isomerase/thioredoxin